MRDFYEPRPEKRIPVRERSDHMNKCQQCGHVWCGYQRALCYRDECIEQFPKAYGRCDE